MTQDELDDEILLAMLRRSRLGQGPIFDLLDLCKEEGIAASTNQILAFTTNNRGIDGSNERTTFDAIRFEISAHGLRRAKQIEETRKPPSISDRLANDKFQKIGNLSISLFSLIVSIGALAVAIYALSKGG